MMLGRKVCLGLLILLCSFSLSVGNTPALEGLSVYDKPIIRKDWTFDSPLFEIMFPAFQFNRDEAIEHANKLKKVGFTVLRLGSLSGKDDTNVRPETYKALIDWAHSNHLLIGGYNPGYKWRAGDKPDTKLGVIDDEGKLYKKWKRCFADDWVARGKIGGISDVLSKFAFDRLDLFDETCWPGAWSGPDMPWVCYAHRDKFVAYLKSHKLKPSDFDTNWKTWDDMIMPTRKNWQASSAEHKLYFAFRRWKEDVFFDFLYNVCNVVNKKYPKLKINAGIMTPCGIMNGARTCVPMTRFRELSADSVDYDTYYFLSGRNHCALWNEEINEFITDITGLPLELTKYLKNPSDSDKNINAYALWPMTSLLLNDNVIGVNYYYYNRPYKKIRITVPHERFDALSRSFAYIKEAYSVVHSIPERHCILVVTEDPIHRGLMRREIYYGRGLWRLVQRAHYDADFAIPRMLKNMDLSQYQMIGAYSKHISDGNLRILLDWASKSGHTLVRYHHFAKYDDFHIDRSSEREKMLKSIVVVRDEAQLQRIIKKSVSAVPYEPLMLVEGLDIDVRVSEDGKRWIAVITNDNRQKKEFRFKLKCDKKISVKPMFNLGNFKYRTSYSAGQPIIDVSMPAFSMQVFDICVK